MFQLLSCCYFVVDDSNKRLYKNELLINCLKSLYLLTKNITLSSYFMFKTFF